MDGADFAILASNFGRGGMTHEQGDLNGDGKVDGADFAILAGNFGRTVPAPPAAVADEGFGRNQAAPARRRSDGLAPSRRRPTFTPKPAPARRVPLVPKARKKP